MQQVYEFTLKPLQEFSLFNFISLQNHLPQEYKHPGRYLGCIINNRGIVKVECENKVLNRRIGGTIKTLIFYNSHLNSDLKI